MQALRQLLFRLRAAQPGRIEHDVIERQIVREEQEIKSATAEAVAIEHGTEEINHRMAKAMADGKVTIEEARDVCRALIGVSVTAHHHTQHLESLR